MEIEKPVEQQNTNTYVNIRQKVTNLFTTANLKILFTVLDCNPNSTD